MTLNFGPITKMGGLQLWLSLDEKPLNSSFSILHFDFMPDENWKMKNPREQLAPDP